MLDSSTLDRLIGWTVRDRDDDKVGTVNAVFADSDGRPAFLGIRTGWLGMGRSHLIPARLAEIGDGGRTLRVPYDKQTIKDAPDFDDEAALDATNECAIYDYFGVDNACRGLPADPSDEDAGFGERIVEAGGVRLRRIVPTEDVDQPVEATREDAALEREPATSGSVPGASGIGSEEPVAEHHDPAAGETGEVPLREVGTEVEDDARR